MTDLDRLKTALADRYSIQQELGCGGMAIVYFAALTLASLTSPIAAQGLPSSTPEDVGLSTERLVRLDSLMQSYISQGRMAGVVTVVARHGRVAHFRTQGFMDVERAVPMVPDAIFRVRSMTKPITSVAVMMLYEEGRFQLEDPVSKFIPAFREMNVVENPNAPQKQGTLQPVERQVTIRDLLTHVAGLPSGGGSTPLDSMWRSIARSQVYTLQETVERMAALPLLYQPGTAWVYSPATDVLGYLVESVSGVPFEEFLHQRIFMPLGMEDTGFYISSDEAARLANLYRVTEAGGISVVARSAQADPFELPRAPSGAGGLFSTASDYLRFAQMLLNSGELDGVRLLGRKTVKLMTIDHLPQCVELPEVFYNTYRLAGYGFGLGVRVRTDVAASQIPGSVGEYGWGGAYETYFLVDPEEGLVALFMTQLSPSGFYPLRRQFNTLVYQAIVN